MSHRKLDKEIFYEPIWIDKYESKDKLRNINRIITNI